MGEKIYKIYWATAETKWAQKGDKRAERRSPMHKYFHPYNNPRRIYVYMHAEMEMVLEINKFNFFKNIFKRKINRLIKSDV